MSETITNWARPEFNLQAEIEDAQQELEQSQAIFDDIKNQDGSVAIAGLFELANIAARIDQAQRRLRFLQDGTNLADFSVSRVDSRPY